MSELVHLPRAMPARLEGHGWKARYPFGCARASSVALFG